MEVATIARPKNLYEMLEAERFNAFPRGIDVRQGNLHKYGPTGMGLNITIENNLLFYYLLRETIFVSPSNKKLKKRLRKSYKITVADGSWKKKIDSVVHETIIDKPNIKNQVFNPLVNPFLSQKTLEIKVLYDDPLLAKKKCTRGWKNISHKELLPFSLFFLFRWGYNFSVHAGQIL